MKKLIEIQFANLIDKYIFFILKYREKLKMLKAFAKSQQRLMMVAAM